MAALPGLSLGISPSSFATASSGMDYLTNAAPTSTGSVSFGGEDGGPTSVVTGLVRDFAIGAAVALFVKFAWKYVK